MLKKNNFQLLILALSAISIIFLTFTHWEKLTTPYNHKEMGEIYSNSPYVKGPKATTQIGDDGLFAVAGYYLFVQGGDPSQIHFEGPPLGEYLIGLSIVVFHNEFVIALVYGSILLVLVYFLSQELFHDRLVSSFAVFLLAFNELFLRHLHASLLDLPQTLFITLAIYLLVCNRSGDWKYYIGSSFFLGCASATKFFPALIFFVPLFILYVWSTKPKYLLVYIGTLILVPVVYLLSYGAFFMHQHSLLDFFRFQKWVFVWRLGNPRVVGNIFLSLFTGHYRSWWEPYTWITDNEWTLVLGYTIVAGFGCIYWLLRKKYRRLIYWYGLCVVFLIYLALGTTGVSKYIFPVLPLLVIFAAFTTKQLFGRFPLF